MHVCEINQGHSTGRLSLQGDEGLVTSILLAVAIVVAVIGPICRERLNKWPDMQEAIRRLMRLDATLDTFSELAVKVPDLMRLVLQASVAALVNVQAAAVNAELKRRAVTRN